MRCACGIAECGDVADYRGRLWAHENVTCSSVPEAAEVHIAALRAEVERLRAFLPLARACGDVSRARARHNDLCRAGREWDEDVNGETFKRWWPGECNAAADAHDALTPEQRAWLLEDK